MKKTEPFKTYSFAEQVALAKKYEDIMLEYWTALEDVVNVGDVRDKQKYRDMDIDFIHMRLHAGVLKARTLELKVDFRIGATGNLFIETDGWLKKTRAETIAYLDVIKKRCYYINTQSLRTYMELFGENMQEVKVNTGDFGGFEVSGRLFPYEDMIKSLYPYTEDLTTILHD